jgi:glycosyltransferase involved in cell wall biosynthesis
LKSVLCFSAYFYPGFKAGGGLRSVANISRLLGDKCNFKIVTSNHDLGCKKAYEDLTQGKWVGLWNIKVFYCQNKIFNIYRQIKLFKGDAIYINSFFDPFFGVYALLVTIILNKKCRIIIAPRGELSIEALSISKAKKYIYLLLFKNIFLNKSIIWHASSKYEALDINKIFPEFNISVIQDLPYFEIDDNYNVEAISQINFRNPLKLCFIARIVPIKNLEYAIKLLYDLNIPIEFDIYGPIENLDYFESIGKLIDSVPKNIKVKYCGLLNPMNVIKVLSGYHALLFPTKSENFGHVILESLSAGTPVIISDNTPWRDLEVANVGWDIPLSNPKKFKDAILRIASISDFDYCEMRSAAKNFNLGETLHQNIENMYDLLFK